MEASSPCSCHLGGIVRALGLGSRPLPKKRQWQLAASLVLFFFAFVFYMAITRNLDHHGVVALGLFSFFGIATFLAALLSAMVSIVGCDDCVSRM
jgi:ABC-type Fe3+ transport system permease subunit